MISAIAILSAIWRFFCACFQWVLAHKRWSLIIVLVVYGLFQAWQANRLTNDLNKADAKCTVKINQAKIELKQYKADQTEANQKAKTAAITQEKTWAEQLLKVEQNASQKIQDVAAAARNAELAHSRLSEQISRANERMSSASSEAIAEYAKTCNLVLEEMATAGGEIAKSADGHEIDTERLEESWDVVSSEVKPSR